MIWFYLLFFVMEFILGYVMYSAISYRVVPGDIIYKDYVLSYYGICSCSKQDAEKHGCYITVRNKENTVYEYG